MASKRTTADENITELKSLWSSAGVIDYSQPINAFVSDLYSVARSHQADGQKLGTALAALFDLAVSALYLEKIVSTGWYFCELDTDHPKFVYPFVNACPTCSLDGEFHHLKAKKPESASIGQATSKILCALLDKHVQFDSDGSAEMRIVGGNGLVDALMLEEKHFTLFEIKSAPLLAFPLEAPGNNLTDLDEFSGETVTLGNHSSVTSKGEQHCKIIIDKEIRIPVGNSNSFSQGGHYKHILDWLSDHSNYSKFLTSWLTTFKGYADPSARSTTYWLTNGCGAPTPRPKGWPARSAGTGVESISDGKSSVGLDRTDDVKKGIYQVLKISTTYKEPQSHDGYKVSAALASNIHAVKHHADYLSQLEDLIWTVDGKEFTYVIERNSDGTLIKSDGLHNLFDGLITFTSPYFRDDYLAGRFDF